MRKLWLLLSVGVAVAVGTAVFVRAFSPAPPSDQTSRVEGASPQPGSGSQQSAESAAESASGSASGQEKNAEEEPTPLYAGEEAVKLREFEHTLYDDNKKPEGKIRGRLAFWDQEMYEIISPLVVSHVKPGAEGDSAENQEGEQEEDTSEEKDKEGEDSEGHDVRLRADRATLVEGKGTVRLYGMVNVDGKDFHITTEDVTYFTSGRRMNSKSPIEVRQYRVNDQGEREVSLLVKGNDSSADLTLKQITIRKNPVMKIYRASQDFLTSDDESGSEGEEEATTGEGDRTVTITAEDKLVYDHPAKKATFTGEVKVQTGSKTLRCQELTVSIQSDDSGSFSVTDINATGRVWLHYADLTAMGDQLTWQNVTQTSELTGNEATLSTPDFTLNGPHLKFFRLNNRFQVNGPGELDWGAGGQEEGEEPNSGGGLLDANGSQKTNIRWQESMTFDKSENWAIFKGQVSAEQDGTSLSGQVLELQFGENNQQVEKGTARGGAKLVKERADGEEIVFTCEEMNWAPGEQTLRLTSAEGEDVHVRTPQQELVAGEVMFEQATGTLRCTAPGNMTVAGTQGSDDQSAPRVSVKWQQSMEYQRQSPARADFQGNVEASTNGRIIRSEKLDVSFDDEMTPTEIVASGNARLLSGGSADAKAEDGGGTDGEGTSQNTGSVGLPQGTGGMGNWSLESSQFTIQPEENLLTADSPGTITMEGNGQQTPKSIRWTDSMQYRGADGSAVFRGDVRARVSGTHLESDRLNADFSQEGGLRYVRARRNVLFTGVDNTNQGSWELRSESAEAIFQGNSTLREVIARDNVRVSDPRGRLKSELLHLFFDEAQTEGGPPELSRAIAEKDVYVDHRNEPEIEAYGDKLTWDYGKNRYVLTGQPYARVVRGNSKAKYEKLIINRESGEVKAPKGSRPGEIQIVPGKQ